MSDKAQNLFDEAMQASNNGDTSRATDLLKQVVDEDPENIAAWEALARHLTDHDERRMALTTVLQLDPENEYARNALESVEKAKTGLVDNAELVPGIPMKQARMVGIGLVVYTLLVCGVTLLITSAIGGNRAAAAQKIAEEYGYQTQTKDATNLTATQAGILATQQAADAIATQQAMASPTATATATRGFADLPTEIPPTATATTQSFRVEGMQPPPSLPGRVLAWGGRDVRSKEFLPLRIYNLSQPGVFEPLLTLGRQELGRNPLMSPDNITTAFEQWRPDAPRLYMSILEDYTPGGTLDALLGTQLLVTDLKDPSLSADSKRIVFIGTDYNTGIESAYLGDLTDLYLPKFYKLSQDAAAYTGITLAPDGTHAVAVRVDGGSTDLVVFDLVNIAAAAVPATPTVAVGEGTPVVAVGEGTPTATPTPIVIPLRPLTTDGNTLIEGNPAFSPDGTRIVYDAASSSAPDNRDLYIVPVGTAPGAPVPIMTTDGDDIFPAFSPDGNMVAFASDRQTGIYNLFIFDTTTRSTYQLTEEEFPVFPGAWVN